MLASVIIIHAMVVMILPCPHDPRTSFYRLRSHFLRIQTPRSARLSIYANMSYNPAHIPQMFLIPGVTLTNQSHKGHTTLNPHPLPPALSPTHHPPRANCSH